MKKIQKTPFKLFSYSFLLVLVISSCESKRVEITSDYILNEHWNQKANSIELSRMKLKSNKTLNLNSLNQADVVENLEIDSSFQYVANVTSTSSLSSKKVYFAKDNGFFWVYRLGESKLKVLGNLKMNCWYRVSLDTYQNEIYIFIDSLNIVHRQDVIPTNY